MPKTTALITGASSGIGSELARIHATKGDNVVLVARRANRLQELAAELKNTYNVSTHIIAKDLSDQQAAREVYDELQENGIVVDYLINNAGIGDQQPFHTADWQKQHSMINLNIYTLSHLSRLFASEMVNRGQGKIMNVASTAAFTAGPGMSVYYASKHYVLAFSEALAHELKPHGITVTTLCPGPTESEFQSRANLEHSPLFTLFPTATSRQVADYGYKAMMRGKTIAVHGISNKIMVQLLRITPRFLARKIVDLLH